MKARAAVAALVALLLVLPVPAAKAQIPVTDVAHIASATYHQVIHYIARALEIYQKYQIIYNQYNQLVYQVQALAKLEDPSFREIAGLLFEINLILDEAESLVYSLRNLNVVFKETFPGWEEPADWNTATITQVRRTLNTLRAALNTVNAQDRYLADAKVKLDQMKSQVTSVEGHEAALELQSTIGAFSAEELLLLRQAVATSNNIQAVYFATTVNERAQAEATLQSLAVRTAFTHVPPPPGYNFRPHWWPFF
jgi:P-type conjugative transfer protein TrbJ